MLAWLGENEASQRLMEAIEAVCEQGIKTRDLAGTGSTREVTDAVCEEVRRNALGRG